MQRCYYHPKIEAIAHCQGCKMTICCHCVEADLCPDCAKLRRFVQRGFSGARPPRLVEPPAPKRSVTMELMLDRLQRQVFSESESPHRPDKLPRKLIDKEARAGSPRRNLKKTSVKARQPMAYGFLMPSVAPLIRVSRSPISRMAVLMLIAFSLGTFFARQGSVSATVPSAEAPMAHSIEQELEPRDPQAVSVQYKPVYIHVPVRQGQTLVSTPRAGMPAAVRPAAAPRAAEAPVAPSKAASYPIASRQKFAPAPEAAQDSLPAPEAALPSRLEVAFPHPGNIVRSTSMIRVRVSNPGKLALVNLALDGKPIKAVPEIAELLEVPLDTTAFQNGDHALQILAMEVDGTIRSSETVPITIRN